MTSNLSSAFIFPCFSFLTRSSLASEPDREEGHWNQSISAWHDGRRRRWLFFLGTRTWSVSIHLCFALSSTVSSYFEGKSSPVIDNLALLFDLINSLLPACVLPFHRVFLHWGLDSYFFAILLTNLTVFSLILRSSMSPLGAREQGAHLRGRSLETACEHYVQLSQLWPFDGHDDYGLGQDCALSC